MERTALTEMQMMATLHAAGAKNIRYRSPEEAVADFNTALYAEPAPLSLVDSDQLRLRRAMGVA